MASWFLLQCFCWFRISHSKETLSSALPGEATGQVGTVMGFFSGTTIPRPLHINLFFLFVFLFILAGWSARIHILLHPQHRWMTMLKLTSAIMPLQVWVASNNLPWWRRKYNQVLLLPTQLELITKISLDHVEHFIFIFSLGIAIVLSQRPTFNWWLLCLTCLFT